MKKEYLGDGAYVEAKYGGLQLTTENGISVTNSIFLEPEVYAALLEYVARLRTDTDKCPDCGHRAHAGVSCFESDACGCGQ